MRCKAVTDRVKKQMIFEAVRMIFEAVRIIFEAVRSNQSENFEKNIQRLAKHEIIND